LVILPGFRIVPSGKAGFLRYVWFCRKIPADDNLPYGIYSIPEISGIGLTERQAVDLGIDVTVGRAYYENLTRADLNHETDGILKLVFRTDNLKLWVFIFLVNMPQISFTSVNL
jgi:hypothetical protein